LTLLENTAPASAPLSETEPADDDIVDIETSAD
jgi:hypothetical protein